MTTSSLWASTETLHFEKKMIAVTLESEATQTEITFTFENRSKKAVEIARHQAPCACISSKLKDDKKIYQPGEKGAIITTFNVKNLFGTVEKQILVWLKGDQKNQPLFVLSVKITIPELIHLTPRTLSWDVDGDTKTQTCKIIVNHKEPIHITKIASTNNNFTPELKTLRDGWEYELTVTAKDTSNTSFGILKITTDSTVSRFRRTQAFVYVRHESATKK